MQLLLFYQWTKPVLLLFAVVAIGSGCGELEQNGVIDTYEVELGEAETGDSGVVDDQRSNIPGHYIVMLKKGANSRAVAAAVRANPEHMFTSVMSGFAGPLNPGQLQALSRRRDVVRIEPDQVVTAADGECPDVDPTTQNKTAAPDYAPAYSVDRIDQRDRPLSNSYNYTSSGEGVNVYIFDTWLDTEHPDFGGRASAGYDGYPNDPSNGEDCSGHATHVAGIAGGTKYGVAKDVNLISVEVLDCTGHGSWSRLLAGIEWVMENNGDTPAVANMSLSGSGSWIVDEAIDELADSGVFVAVAAGNDDRNACNVSPARADSAMTVAASNSADERASFSNYGSCVDIYAGGTNVRSAWPGGLSRAGSGTSMASPHVAGAAALYKQTFGDAPWDEIKSYLETWASANKITSNAPNTPNLLLYWPCSG